VNNEWERIWKEAVVINFNVLSQYMAGGSDENHKSLSQDRQSSVKDSNPRRPEYEEGVPHFRAVLNPFTTNSDYMHCLSTVPSASTHIKC